MRTPDLVEGPNISAGCGGKFAPLGRTLTSRVMPIHERVTYVPRNYDPNHPHPVVIFVQTIVFPPAMTLDGTEIERIADEHGFVVLMFDKPNRLAEWIPNDIDFMFRQLGDFANEVCLDLDRVFVVGHGTGTELARELACRANIAGLALTGDLERFPRCESDPVPVIRIAGKLDRYVPLEGGENCLNQQVRALADVETAWRETNQCTPEKSAWGPTSGGRCHAYTCTGAPFVSCLIDGGHNFPKWQKGVNEISGCGRDAPTTFPMMSTIWKFFDDVEVVDTSVE